MQLHKNIFIFPDEISHYGHCTHKLLLTFIPSKWKFNNIFRYYSCLYYIFIF